MTALVRRPPRPEFPPGVGPVQGNVMDPASLDGAMAGQEAVLCALGHKRWLGPSRILSEGTRHLLAAMERHGVRRLVAETALGIGDSWWRMGVYYTLLVRPFILPFYFHDKVRQEAVIRASGADWTIVRPGALTNDPRTGRVRHGPGVGHWLWTVRVSRADVAAFMLDQLDDASHLQATVAISR